MFRDMLCRIEAGSASPFDMHTMCEHYPEQVLASPSLPMLALEHPELWIEVRRKALVAVSFKYAVDLLDKCFSIDNAFKTRARVLILASERFHHVHADNLKIMERHPFVSCTSDGNLRNQLARMAHYLAGRIPDPVCPAAEEVAILCHLVGDPVPEALVPYVDPWTSWPRVVSQPDGTDPARPDASPDQNHP